MTGYGREQLADGADPALVAATAVAEDLAAAVDRILLPETAAGP
jgi:hypothetical protein